MSAPWFFKRAYFAIRKSLFRNPKEPISQPERASFENPLHTTHSTLPAPHSLNGASFASRAAAFSKSMTLLSRFLLYPAMTFLGFGIFIGAMWANISWGSYWSWDAKETWALITFMVYAPALHTASLQTFRRPVVYNLYVAAAFLSILMTYFGCNYFLSGMHSYA